MQALLLSIVPDMAAEIGDKSQLVVLLMALRFRKPLPVVLGMLAGTAAAHALAGAAGLVFAAALDPAMVRAGVGSLFVALGLWTLFPGELARFRIVGGKGVFLTAALTYFLAETGGKTFLLTAAISAHTGTWTGVVIGTVLGEVLVNAPLVVLGDRLARGLERRAVDFRWIAGAAGVLLALMGLAELLGVDPL